MLKNESAQLGAFYTLNCKGYNFFLAFLYQIAILIWLIASIYKPCQYLLSLFITNYSQLDSF